MSTVAKATPNVTRAMTSQQLRHALQSVEQLLLLAGSTDDCCDSDGNGGGEGVSSVKTRGGDGGGGDAKEEEGDKSGGGDGEVNPDPPQSDPAGGSGEGLHHAALALRTELMSRLEMKTNGGGDGNKKKNDANDETMKTDGDGTTATVTATATVSTPSSPSTSMVGDNLLKKEIRALRNSVQIDIATFCQQFLMLQPATAVSTHAAAGRSGSGSGRACSVGRPSSGSGNGNLTLPHTQASPFNKLGANRPEAAVIACATVFLRNHVAVVDAAATTVAPRPRSTEPTNITGTDADLPDRGGGPGGGGGGGDRDLLLLMLLRSSYYNNISSSATTANGDTSNENAASSASASASLDWTNLLPLDVIMLALSFLCAPVVITDLQGECERAKELRKSMKRFERLQRRCYHHHHQHHHHLHGSREKKKQLHEIGELSQKLLLRPPPRQVQFACQIRVGGTKSSPSPASSTSSLSRHLGLEPLREIFSGELRSPWKEHDRLVLRIDSSSLRDRMENLPDHLALVQKVTAADLFNALSGRRGDGDPWGAVPTTNPPPDSDDDDDDEDTEDMMENDTADDYDDEEEDDDDDSDDMDMYGQYDDEGEVLLHRVFDDFDAANLDNLVELDLTRYGCGVGNNSRKSDEKGGWRRFNRNKNSSTKKYDRSKSSKYNKSTSLRRIQDYFLHHIQTQSDLSVLLPETVTEIGDEFLADGRISSIRLVAPGLKVIGSNCFGDCERLISLGRRHKRRQRRRQEGRQVKKDSRTTADNDVDDRKATAKVTHNNSTTNTSSSSGSGGVCDDDYDGDGLSSFNVNTISTNTISTSISTSAPFPSSVTEVGDYFCWDCKELRHVDLTTIIDDDDDDSVDDDDQAVIEAAADEAAAVAEEKDRVDQQHAAEEKNEDDSGDDDDEEDGGDSDDRVVIGKKRDDEQQKGRHQTTEEEETKDVEKDDEEEEAVNGNTNDSEEEHQGKNDKNLKVSPNKQKQQKPPVKALVAKAVVDPGAVEPPKGLPPINSIDVKLSEEKKNFANEKQKLREWRRTPGLKKVGDHFLSRCRSLVSVLLPPTIVEIGDSFLERTRSLRRLDLSNMRYLESIPSGFLEDCSGLCDLRMPPNVSIIDGENFLRGCRSLSVLDLAAQCPKLIEINGEGFACGCRSLETLRIPNGGDILLARDENVLTSSFFLRGCFSLATFDIEFPIHYYPTNNVHGDDGDRDISGREEGDLDFVLYEDVCRSDGIVSVEAKARSRILSVQRVEYGRLPVVAVAVPETEKSSVVADETDGTSGGLHSDSISKSPEKKNEEKKKEEKGDGNGNENEASEAVARNVEEAEEEGRKRQYNPLSQPESAPPSRQISTAGNTVSSPSSSPPSQLQQQQQQQPVRVLEVPVHVDVKPRPVEANVETQQRRRRFNPLSQPESVPPSRQQSAAGDALSSSTPPSHLQQQQQQPKGLEEVPVRTDVELRTVEANGEPQQTGEPQRAERPTPTEAGSGTNHANRTRQRGDDADEDEHEKKMFIIQTLPALEPSLVDEALQYYGGSADRLVDDGLSGNLPPHLLKGSSTSDHQQRRRRSSSAPDGGGGQPTSSSPISSFATATPTRSSSTPEWRSKLEMTMVRSHKDRKQKMEESKNDDEDEDEDDEPLEHRKMVEAFDVYWKEVEEEETAKATANITSSNSSNSSTVTTTPPAPPPSKIISARARREALARARVLWGVMDESQRATYESMAKAENAATRRNNMRVMRVQVRTILAKAERMRRKRKQEEDEQEAGEGQQKKTEKEAKKLKRRIVWRTFHQPRRLRSGLSDDGYGGDSDDDNRTGYTDDDDDGDEALSSSSSWGGDDGSDDSDMDDMMSDDDSDDDYSSSSQNNDSDDSDDYDDSDDDDDSDIDNDSDVPSWDDITSSSSSSGGGAAASPPRRKNRKGSSSSHWSKRSRA